MPTIEAIAEAVGSIAPDYRIKNAALFGSCARGEASAESDVDIVIETDPGFSLFDAVRFKSQLKVLLSTEVDVLSRNALRGAMAANVKEDQVVLYVRS